MSNDDKMHGIKTPDDLLATMEEIFAGHFQRVPPRIKVAMNLLVRISFLTGLTAAWEEWLLKLGDLPNNIPNEDGVFIMDTINTRLEELLAESKQRMDLASMDFPNEPN